jgi:hypothetical protein
VHHESISRYSLLAGVSQASFKKKHPQNLQVDPSKLTVQLGEGDLDSLTPEEVLSFLTDINQGTNQLTKRTRYSQLLPSSTSSLKTWILISEQKMAALVF